MVAVHVHSSIRKERDLFAQESFPLLAGEGRASLVDSEGPVFTYDPPPGDGIRSGSHPFTY